MKAKDLNCFIAKCISTSNGHKLWVLVSFRLQQFKATTGQTHYRLQSNLNFINFDKFLEMF